MLAGHAVGFQRHGRRPGKIPIACGYFVSTVLQDAGRQVDHFRLAQQPSSRILTSLIPGDDCRLMVDLPYEDICRVRSAA